MQDDARRLSVRVSDAMREYCTSIEQYQALVVGEAGHGVYPVVIPGQ